MPKIAQKSLVLVGVGNMGTFVSPPIIAWLASATQPDGPTRWDRALIYSAGMFFVAVRIAANYHGNAGRGWTRLFRRTRVNVAEMCVGGYALDRAGGFALRTPAGPGPSDRRTP